MAKKTIDNAPLLLAKDKETLKAAVLERIELGEKLAQTAVLTAEEKDKLEKEFKLWNHVNYEMIATAFTVRRHMHEHEYVYHKPIDVDDIYGRRRQPSLQDEINEVRSAFSTQGQKLRHFHELIDLQQVAPGVQPPARKGR